jgi:hypothetical protein
MGNRIPKERKRKKTNRALRHVQNNKKKVECPGKNENKKHKENV